MQMLNQGHLHICGLPCHKGPYFTPKHHQKMLGLSLKFTKTVGGSRPHCGSSNAPPEPLVPPEGCTRRRCVVCLLPSFWSVRRARKRPHLDSPTPDAWTVRWSSTRTRFNKAKTEAIMLRPKTRPQPVSFARSRPN